MVVMCILCKTMDEIWCTVLYGLHICTIVDIPGRLD